MKLFFILFFLSFFPFSLGAQISIPLTSLTLEELKTATAAQIKANIAAKAGTLDKKALIQALTGVETETKLIDSKDQKEGQTFRVFVTTDVLGTKLSSQRIEWTYYPTGEVDEITTIELDAGDKEISRRVIKHSKIRGVNPTVSIKTP